MKHGTSLGSQAGRWIILAALVVALGALLLTIRPVGAQQDTAPTLSNAVTAHDYAENGTGPITTFRARDPEGKPIFWTLGGADAADFTIDGGVLRFNAVKFPNGPNYEVPTDRHDDTDNDGTVDAGEDPAGNNVYKVTVRFGAGGEDGTPNPTDDYAGDDLGEVDLTVTVTNVDEKGQVTVSPRQPQVGTTLTAILTDPDNVQPGVGEWQWARSDSENGPWEDIPALSTGMTYQPTIDDENKWLRVTVVYVDRAGADSRTENGFSEFTVREDVVTSNQPPKFPDQSTLTGVTTPSPDRTQTDRFISEGAAAGAPVGAPVTAFDDATEIEVITYSLRDPAGASGTDNTDGNNDDDNPDTPSASDGHAASFNIHATTGQITVSDGAMLNADTGGTNPYVVVVRAVDGDGDTADITLRVHVQDVNEPPTIDRVYMTDRVPTATGSGAVTISVGDRAPTEMSHYELDRDNAPATVIDTNLDTDAAVSLEPATYYATDPEGGTITWSLAGDDAGRFVIDTNPATEDVESTGPSGTLRFSSGPDWEARSDENDDNVYEVTIVASAPGGSDMLPVTVKVLNSTDDNTPGSVTFENRQPEVNTALKANFEDTDGGVTVLKWQWYRASATSTGACDNRTPTNTDPVAGTDTINDRRYFVENDADTVAAADPGWRLIDSADARSATYTPKAVYEADGTTHAADSDFGKCLRATVSYRDGVDRTHSAANVQGTAVDETLEGTWAATEQPVKAVDENNDAPSFTVDGTSGTDRVSVYRSRVTENGDAVVFLPAVVPAAVDPADGEDDDSDTTTDGPDTDNDRLTYSLSGRDADAFTITGTIDHNNVLDAALAADGTLTFDGGGDYEDDREYRVTIKATDPSGDSGSVTVIVDVDNINERPSFTMGNAEVAYNENDTIPVGTYKAVDPEGSGITYSIQSVVVTAVDDDGTDANVEAGSGAIAAVTAADIVDRDQFQIGSITGILEFKASPNFEDPKDLAEAPAVADNNVYHVTVRAEVSDNTNPRHFATQTVTVTVNDVNEAPVFAETTDTLQITENPDDPRKEKPLAARDQYLLNRGVGIPSPANPPAVPNLDVGTPMTAIDDDNSRDIDYTGTGFDRTSRSVQLIDSLTYELNGADAGYFDIVPATGQILTVKKLDYELKSEFDVTVTATDPEGLSGSIDVTINVLNIDEVPVPDILRIAGENEHTVAENSEDALGTYTVSAGGDAVIGAWTLEGADASHFMVDGSGDSIMLKFASAPDYDAMADADGDNTYMVTLKNTDPNDSTIFDTFAVTVIVTDVDELGSLSGPGSASTIEGVMESLGTYTVTGGDGTTEVTLSVDGADKDHFMLGGTDGMDLMFASAPDYEMPRGQEESATNTNTYIVTVKAEAGGEMEMVEVTVMVDNAEEGGEVIFTPASAEVGTAITASVKDGDIVDQSSVQWSWARGDGTNFDPIAGEASDTYTTVESDMGMYLMATAIYRDGYDAGNKESATIMVAALTVSGMASVDYAENGTGDVATYTASVSGASWSLEGDDMDDLSIDSSSGVLTFNSSPNYEMPTDMNMDNMYMVTVVATVGSAMATMDVTVEVTDVDEGPVVRYDSDGDGMISISELFAAIDAYFEDGLSISDLFDIIDAYFNGNG